MRSDLIQAFELLQKRDTETLNEALRLLQTTVFSFSMKICGHREDAEDTMQDVMIKAVPYLPKIKDPKALAVWLYKVARNRCWMSRRRSKFAPKETLSLDEFIPDATELESLIATHHQSQETLVLSNEESSRVRHAIEQVPPEYRIILVLHDMEELDTSEVAQIMGLREGTIRVRLHRARLQLRRELQQANGPDKRHKRQRRIKRDTPLQCRKMFAELSEYMDGRIDQLACDHIHKHLLDCPPCLAFVQDLERAVQRCRSYQVECQPKTADRIRQLLVNEYVRALDASKKSSSTATPGQI